MIRVDTSCRIVEWKKDERSSLDSTVEKIVTGKNMRLNQGLTLTVDAGPEQMVSFLLLIMLSV